MNLVELKNILVNLGILAFFCLLCVANSFFALPKTKRYRHFPMPFFALAYGIVTIILFNDFQSLIIKFTDWISQWLPFMKDFDHSGFFTVVYNILAILGFVLLKTLLLPLMNALFSANSLAEKTSRHFYENDDQLSGRFLKPEYTNIATFFRWIYYALVLVSAVLLFCAFKFRDNIVFSGVMYPYFPLLILGETMLFLSGITKSKFIREVLGQDEEEFKEPNYGGVRNILRSLFGDKLLYESTSDATGEIADNGEELSQLLDSEDPETASAAEYFSNLRQTGKDISIEYVKSSINLIKGKSTLFATPFYRDLTDYLIMPMVKQLIRYRKCLVITGRDSSAENIREWLSEAFFGFTGTDSLWKTAILGEDTNNTDVGIIRFCDLYSQSVLKSNELFFENTGFVLLTEPSAILATGQIGLRMLVSLCEKDDNQLVFAATDRNCDGLVDSLSHILKTEITEVTATHGGAANSSAMFWDADGEPVHNRILPSVSHYLGLGTEFSSVALKYRIQDTLWIGNSKFPVTDIKWIDGQYYKQICSYCNLPSGQENFAKHFSVSTDIYGIPVADNLYVTAEDEFRNIFEAARIYSTRARSQGFVNIISENYLLRDYMIDNADLFAADPKAIPTIVPDFARTERNTVLSLLILMMNGPVSESRIIRELELCGIPAEDPYETLKKLILKHCDVDEVPITPCFREEQTDNIIATDTKRYYEIDEGINGLRSYTSRLSNAYYIAENEKDTQTHIGAKLLGHVFQMILPGQYATINGKYYRIESITAQGNVIVRRAADNLTNRFYYRQMQTVTLSDVRHSGSIGSIYSKGKLEVAHCFANLKIDTHGYLEMKSAGDFAKAKRVSIGNIPSRSYRNKEFLRIRLPGSTEKDRFTICFLLNEIFATTYPTANSYVSSLTVCGNLPEEDDNRRFAVHDIEGETEDDCIYIIEDSDIDLGLISSVEKNLSRFFGIASDVLDWHNEKMKSPGHADDSEDTGEFVPEFLPGKKKGIFGKIKDFFGKFRKKKGKDDREKDAPPASGAPDNPVTEVENPVADGNENGEKTEKKKGLFARLKERFKKKHRDENDGGDTAEADSQGQKPKKEKKKKKKHKNAAEEEITPAPEQLPENGYPPTTSEPGPGEAYPGNGYPVPYATEDNGNPVQYTPADSGYSGHIPYGDPEPEPQFTSTEHSGPDTEEEAELIIGPDGEQFTDAAPMEEYPQETGENGSQGDPDETNFEILFCVETPVQEENAPEQKDNGCPSQEDFPGREGSAEDEPAASMKIDSDKYAAGCFIKMGAQEFDGRIDTEGALGYLQGIGFGDSGLTAVRKRDNSPDAADTAGKHYCDFCGAELISGDFDKLSDGRERCRHCSLTAVKTVEEFTQLYQNVSRNLETFYNVRINVPIRLRMTTAAVIAKQTGSQFIPTKGFDPRVIGFARKEKGAYSLYIENGSPRIASTATIAHELTHIWQYLNWKDSEIEDKYGKEHALEVYEGMAKWSEIQYLYLLGEKSYAERQEATTRLRNDEYGHGFVQYAAKYPLSKSQTVGKKIPFNIKPPL